jgi:hypothetical protein
MQFSSAGRAVAAPFAQKREEQRKEQWSSFSKGLGATVGAFGAAAVLVSVRLPPPCPLVGVPSSPLI